MRAGAVAAAALRLLSAGTGARGLKLYRDLDAELVRGLVAEAHRTKCGMRA